MNSNENPYGLSRRALEAFNRSARVGSAYPDGAEDETRNAIAASHGVPPERIVLGCGSSDILRMADAAFLAGGKGVVAAEPTFEAVLLYAGVMQAVAAKVPLTADFRHDLPKMAAACGETTGLVYVCNPNNPTGTIVSRRGDRGRFSTPCLRRRRSSWTRRTTTSSRTASYALRDRPARRAPQPRRGSDLLEDLRDGGAASRLRRRVGATAAALSRQAGWNNTNAPGLAAALAALRDPELVPSQRRLFTQTRTWLGDALKREGRRYIPSQTNFVMIHVGSDVSPIIRAFRERKILVGRKFPSMPDWLRVSIGRRTEMEAFLAALREVVPARAAA